MQQSALQHHRLQPSQRLRPFRSFSKNPMQMLPLDIKTSRVGVIEWLKETCQERGNLNTYGRLEQALDGSLELLLRTTAL